jgi:hypothetical protein
MGHPAYIPHIPPPEPEGLRLRVRDELDARRKLAQRDPMPMILSGAVESALDDLLYYTEPAAFRQLASMLRSNLVSAFVTATHNEQSHMLRFSAEMAIRLGSAIPAWNLSHERANPNALSPTEVHRIAGDFRGLVAELARHSSAAKDSLLDTWRAETASRYRAEKAEDPAEEAFRFVGSSISAYIEAMGGAVMSSNLRRIADMRWAGSTRTEISNDYAAFLPYMLLLGASFVTCNPPLVDLAWKAEPGLWDPVVDRVIDSHPNADPDDLALSVTLEIVLANMLRLRPIFLLTGGCMGFVSLQVNPGRHEDAASMIRDARLIHRRLQIRLNGGVPNVVFKLPATSAGLEACAALVSEAIGVNITVNFGLFQHLAFANTIRHGNAPLGVLSHMSGRLAYPIRDELLGKLGELSKLGVSESKARQAAAWSGVAVLKRLHCSLQRRNTDLGRIRPLIASLRVYEGEAYTGLPSPIPDITEAIGTGILTVFPNVRRAFDRLSIATLDGQRIDTPVPDEVLGVLRHSEIFKQAYWLGPLATSGESDSPELRPSRPISLADREATAAWTPAENTLSEFVKAYDSFVERILTRQQRAG